MIAPISFTSRSHESAFLALVGDALIAALVAPSDLVLPALGALEERVAVTNESLSAGRAYFVSCHALCDTLFNIKSAWN